MRRISTGPRRGRWTTVARPALAVAMFALLASACSSGDAAEDGTADNAAASDAAAADDGAGGGASLDVLIASSGDAETDAVREAADAWASETGNSVTVTVAQDINQQLGQAFAGGNPPDVFYVDASRVADYASNDALYPYVADMADPDDFYPPLVDTFTYEGEQMCAPKDFSTLALVINLDAWEAAGLGDDDIPTNWNELEAVAAQLTTDDQAGLVVGDTRDRINAFLVQNGGWLLSEDASEVTAVSDANVEALEYVKGLLTDGSLKYPTAVDTGWGGEAFGVEAAAMTIEGNWIKGALANDYPDVPYEVVELPEGPAGKGTLLFTQCWGIAQASNDHAAAVSLVDALTAPEQQLEFAEAFGVMPSRPSAEAGYVEQYPEDAAFIAGGEYGQGPVTVAEMTPVLDDFDAGLQQLDTADPAQLLQDFADNAQAVLGQ